MCCVQDVGASQEEGIALYDVTRPEYMSPECNTADTDNAPPPGYDVICKENLPAEYTPTTSENPPPLPPPMLLGDSEAPDLPPPYNPAVDNESVAVDLSIYEREMNQSVLEGEVVEAGDTSQGGEAENGGDSGQEEKIAAQVTVYMYYVDQVNDVCGIFICGIIPYMYVRAAFVVSLCWYFIGCEDCTAVCAW